MFFILIILTCYSRKYLPGGVYRQHEMTHLAYKNNDAFPFVTNGRYGGGWTRAGCHSAFPVLSPPSVPLPEQAEYEALQVQRRKGERMKREEEQLVHMIATCVALNCAGFFIAEALFRERVPLPRPNRPLIFPMQSQTHWSLDTDHANSFYRGTADIIL